MFRLLKHEIDHGEGHYDLYGGWRDECLCGPCRVDFFDDVDSDTDCDSEANINFMFNQGRLRVYFIYRSFTVGYSARVDRGENFKLPRHYFSLKWRNFRYSGIDFTDPRWPQLESIPWPS